MNLKKYFKFKTYYSFLKNFWDNPKPLDLLTIDVINGEYEDLAPKMDGYLKYKKMGKVDFEQSTSKELIILLNLNTTLEQIAIFEREWSLYGVRKSKKINSDREMTFQFECI